MLLYIEDRLSAGERQRVEHHVGKCEVCSPRFAALARLPHILQESVPIEVSETVLDKAKELVRTERRALQWAFRPASRYRWAFASLAATVILSAVVLLIRNSETHQFRSADRTVPGLIMSPADGAAVADAHRRFSWSSLRSSSDPALPAVSVYRFSLLDQQGVTIWSSDVRDTTIVLPPSVVLVPGKTYLWRVESLLAGRSLERSSLHVFTYTHPK
jgi:hypothetical protein